MRPSALRQSVTCTVPVDETVTVVPQRSVRYSSTNDSLIGASTRCAGAPAATPGSASTTAVAKLRTTALRTMRPPLVVETPPPVGALGRHYGRSRAAVKPDVEDGIIHVRRSWDPEHGPANRAPEPIAQ